MRCPQRFCYSALHRTTTYCVLRGITTYFCVMHSTTHVEHRWQGNVKNTRQLTKHHTVHQGVSVWSPCDASLCTWEMLRTYITSCPWKCIGSGSFDAIWWCVVAIDTHFSRNNKCTSPASLNCSNLNRPLFASWNCSCQSSCSLVKWFWQWTRLNLLFCWGSLWGWHCNFTKYCACYEKCTAASPNIAPATKL